MTSLRRGTALLAALFALIATAPEHRADAASEFESEKSVESEAPTKKEEKDEPKAERKLEYLVPELEGSSFKMEPGPRRFRHRFALTPTVGRLGSEPYFGPRLAYNPNSWHGLSRTVLGSLRLGRRGRRLGVRVGRVCPGGSG